MPFNDQELLVVKSAAKAKETGDVLGAYLQFRLVFAPRLPLSPDDHNDEELLCLVDHYAETAIRIGAEGEAEQILGHQANGFREAGLIASAGVTFARRAGVFSMRGQIDTAFAELQKAVWAPLPEPSSTALTDWERSCPWPEARGAQRSSIFSQLHIVHARLRMATGHFRAARLLLKCADHHAHCADLNRRPFLEASVAELTALHSLECGDLETARKALNRICYHEPSREVYLEVQAALAWASGQLGTAQHQLEELIDTQFRAGRFVAAVGSLGTLVTRLILLNRTHEARRLLERVTAAQIPLTQMQSKHLETLHLFSLMREADAWMDHHPVPSIVDFTLTASSFPCESLLQRFERACLHYRLTLDLEGHSNLEFLEDTYNTVDSPLVQAQLEECRALAMLHRHEYRAALSTLRRNTIYFCEAGLRQAERQTHALIADTAETLGDTTVAREARIEEHALAERFEHASEDDRILYESNKRTTAQRHLRAWTEHLTTSRDDTHWSRPLPMAWRELRHLDALDQNIGHCRRQERNIISRIWTTTADNVVTVRIAVLPEVTLLFVLERKRLHVLECPEDSRRLLQWITDFYETTKVCSRSDADAARKILKSLASALRLQEISHLADKRPLRIVPDALHAIPFAALPVDGQYLADRHAVTLAFETFPRPTCFTATKVKTCTYYSQDPPESINKPLANALEEIMTVARSLEGLGQPCCSLNPSHNRADLLAAIQSSSWAHVVCHGRFVAAHPLDSHFLLANGDRLHVRDLIGANLDGLAFLGMPICWSGQSRLHISGSSFGLPAALWFAGCQSALGCLWAVQSRRALDFTSRFYELLPTTSVAEACRIAQTELRRTGSSKWEKEIGWAVFQTYGEGFTSMARHHFRGR